ncbi:uncharacterized protein LOC120777700 [Bactrocera tryoni]|uniref:uncharacterized protein LOC120777700 n=1 Tax=Bactrocera tryoni TaxID=59916 RepID=UPI001A9986F3|nr:uncharacterized protein LOC120777700 [Bactrocera tryoni]
MRSSGLKSVSCSLAMLILAIILCLCATEIAAAPYQELPPRAGHVPVYIREGDQPLSEIHPGLAEAFHEVAALTQKIEDKKSETAKDDTVSDSKDEKAAPVTEPEPTESDIASFDVIKGIESQNESAAKNDETKDEPDQSKNADKKEE